MSEKTFIKINNSINNIDYKRWINVEWVNEIKPARIIKLKYS